ncbi:uncharacterized protein [Rutidosis leptorrhynchoides]|uniref:uncharacterized protein n=1 Tax=Rutidosis leptorrhynchoides TaxID=125765 RepID=UPI003A9A0075
MTSVTFIRTDPISTKLILTKLKFLIYYFLIFSFLTSSKTNNFEMNYTIPAPAMEAHMCSKMTAADPGLCEFVDQEESSIMESPKRESSEWTDEKHSLYLKSMEASFVDQLYNSFDPHNWQTQNEFSSDSMSSRRVHVSTRCPSGQFKVLQHGSWSTIDFKRENSVRNETNKTHISKSPWIQHFRNGNGHGDMGSVSVDEKRSLTQNSQFPESDLRLHCQQTNFGNAEVTDQNFVQEDSVVQNMNAEPCSKKRKSTSAVSGSGNSQLRGLLPFGTTRVTEIADITMYLKLCKLVFGVITDVEFSIRLLKLRWMQVSDYNFIDRTTKEEILKHSPFRITYCQISVTSHYYTNKNENPIRNRLYKLWKKTGSEREKRPVFGFTETGDRFLEKIGSECMERRKWMYEIQGHSHEYLSKLSEFIKVTYSDRVKKQKEKAPCPC